jgi:hydrogenase expression/formation protein HypC
MKVLEINGTTGTVETGGVRRTADLTLVGPVKPGDYVVVHAGFAISVSDEEEAKKTLNLFDEIMEKAAKLDAEDDTK